MLQNPTSAQKGTLGSGARNRNGSSKDPKQNVNKDTPPRQLQQQQSQSNNTNKNVRKTPFLKITEQPASRALRFRYECEARSFGTLRGANSTTEKKTFPTIQLCGYKGRAIVVVSCVTKDLPYRPHPHNMVGKDGCKQGVCTLEFSSETFVFKSLSIQCVKRKDIEASLNDRQNIRVDPFRTGFSHKLDPSRIDLNAVRLAFQIFLQNDSNGRYTYPLQPVVSEPIFDRKSVPDLVICRLCSCSATVLGNTQIILLCEKVAKEDISIRFFEEKNGKMVWEAFGKFRQSDVYKQTAIVFRTPRYRSLDITEPAKVHIQLQRPSDGITSEALPFEYVPLDSDPVQLRRKRQKTGNNPMLLLLQQQEREHQNDYRDDHTSPLPFETYQSPSEVSTPSTQSPVLSPLKQTYNENIQPSYNSTTSSNAKISPTITELVQHQYRGSEGGPGSNSNMTSMPTKMEDYSTYAQQQHQQQQLQELAAGLVRQQQQFQDNKYLFGDADAFQWEDKYNGTTMTAVADVHVNNNNNNNNMSNLTHPSIPFNAANNLTSNAGGGGMSYQQWNLAPQMHNQPQQQQHHMQQHEQQHYQLQQHQQQLYQQQNDVNNAVAGIVSDILAESSDHGATFNDLLNFDCDQLLRLNSDDLSISSLSIST